MSDPPIFRPALSFDPGPDPQLVREKQKSRRNRSLGWAGTVTSVALAILSHVIREKQVEAQKVELTVTPSEIKTELGEIKTELRAMSERVTKIEQDRLVDERVKAAEEKRRQDKLRKKRGPDEE